MTNKSQTLPKMCKYWHIKNDYDKDTNNNEAKVLSDFCSSFNVDLEMLFYVNFGWFKTDFEWL